MSLTAGILRPGDVVQMWREVDDRSLLIERVDFGGRPSSDVNCPWRSVTFTLDLDDLPPFESLTAADFAERAASEGRISAADAWCTWTAP